MADAVIVDDGGSTRIKRLAGGGTIGALDNLLDVNNLPPSAVIPAGARGSFDDINKAYSTVTIACQNDVGKAFSTAGAPFSTIEVTSQLNQRLVISKTGTKLTITVFSTVSDPIVEAKQQNKKRRYVVSNSGPIDTIRIDGTLVYDVPGGTLIPGATGTIIYSSLVVT